MKYFKRIAVVSTLLGLMAIPAHLEQNAVLTNIEVGSVGATSATFTWLSIVPSTSWVDYGVTAGYGKTVGTSTVASTHSVALTDLENNREYHYQVRSVDAVGNTMSSPDQTFVTTAGSMDTTGPSRVGDLKVIEQTFTSATLEWTATGDDGMLGTARRYDIRRADSDITLRPNTWFEQTLVGGAPVPLLSGTKQRMTLSGFQPGERFSVALRVLDEAGNISDASNVVEVATEPSSTGAFGIRNVRIINLTSTSVVLHWLTNVPATTELMFGKTTDYEMPMPSSTVKTFDHSMVIGGLQSSTLYHFKIQGVDQQGNTSTTADVIVKTF